MIIGIDLGTATSEVAVFRDGRVSRIREVANAPHGFLPSRVGFDADGQLCIGSAAEHLLIPFPDRAVAEAKRLMGTDARINLAGQEFTPQEVAAMLLRHLKAEAEKFAGEPITEA